MEHNDLVKAMQAALARNGKGQREVGYTAQMLAEEVGITEKALRRKLRKLAAAGFLAHSHRDRWVWETREDPEVQALLAVLSSVD